MTDSHLYVYRCTCICIVVGNVLTIVLMAMIRPSLAGNIQLLIKS